MKKLGLFFIAVLVVLTACNKDDNDYPPPIIEFVTESGFVSQDTMLKLGDNFKIGIDASNPDVNLTNFIIRVEANGLETFLDSGMNTPVLHYEKMMVKGISDTEKWTFIIRDRDGKSDEISMSITKDTASVYGPIDYYPNIDLVAQNAVGSSFYSLSENSTFNLSGAFLNQDKIDMVYYYDFIDTDENTIGSSGANIDESVFPGSEGFANWTTFRTTRYKVVELTEGQFLAAQNDSLLVALHGTADGKRKAKNLVEGKSFAFKNEEGRIGLFRVNSISGTDEGSVNISIKVQK